MKRNFFCHLVIAAMPSTAIGILLSTLTWNAYAQAQPVCKALASVNNQLYLVASDGSLLAQFPTDTQSKSSISLSPDGTKVAYSSAASPGAFTVADTAGRVVTFPVQASSQGPFTNVSWDSANVLKVQYHAGRNNDVFAFFSMQADFTSPLRKIGRSVAGENCSAQATDDNVIACLSENKLVVGKKILVDRDPLAPNNVVPLDSATILVGTTLTTQTSPSFQVRVLDISDGVTLKVTMPDGTWSQSRIPLGSALPIAWDENTYGIIPVGINSAKGEVSIKTVKSSGVSASFAPAVTWSPSNYVALVAQGTAGAQLLLVKSSGNQAPMAAGLGTTDLVTSINYDTPTLLMLRTRSGFMSVPVNVLNGSSSGLQTGVIANLPAIMNVKLPGGVAPASVEGWSCH